MRPQTHNLGGWGGNCTPKEKTNWTEKDFFYPVLENGTFKENLCNILGKSTPKRPPPLTKEFPYTHVRDDKHPYTADDQKMWHQDSNFAELEVVMQKLL